MPKYDRDEDARWNAERRAEWAALAEEVTSSDPVFLRWKKMLWTITWITAGIAFITLSWIAIAIYDPKHSKPSHFAVPIFAAFAIVGIGAQLEANRVRKIGIEVWSKKRSEEFKKEKADAKAQRL